jgi:putative FmdB family regulatory protein
MPIYEYQCGKCHEVSEALQRFSDPPLTKCPHCGGKAQRIMSLGAFHLKGSGWYTTDYAGKNSSALKTADTGEAPSTVDKTETAPKKAEKKPEAKPAAPAAE